MVTVIANLVLTIWPYYNEEEEFSVSNILAIEERRNILTKAAVRVTLTIISRCRLERSK